MFFFPLMGGVFLQSLSELQVELILSPRTPLGRQALLSWKIEFSFIFKIHPNFTNISLFVQISGWFDYDYIGHNLDLTNSEKMAGPSKLHEM